MCPYILSLLAASFTFFAFKRMRYLLMFLQQEHYKNMAYIRMALKGLKLIDKRFSGAVILVTILCQVINLPLTVFGILISILSLAFAFKEKNPCKEAKKPLVLTGRAKRILSIALIWMIIFEFLGVWLICYFDSVIIAGVVIICLIQGCSDCLICSNISLKPYEWFVCNGFKQEAIAKFKKINPTTIGITGSYGKTSTKHILGQLLSNIASTYFTKGSINTPMGITRAIREQMNESHKFFVTEMGVGGVNQMEELLEVNNPDFAIITAVGSAHQEFFKTIDAVAKEKFKAAKHVLEKDKGFVILNGDSIDKKYIEKYVGLENDRVIILSADSKKYKNAYVISNQKQTTTGVSFTLKQGKKEYKLEVPIFGLHQAENAALAVIIALKLGVSFDTIKQELKKIPQTKHRLEVLKATNAATIIDDAFNSNPIGFAAALDTLKILKSKSGRAILVTPGMVEMGSAHEEEHKKIGKKAAECADLVLLVRPDRIPSFVKAFKANKNKNQELKTFESFAKAKEWISKNAKSSDVVLIENDLPDSYEAVVKI